jgi:hypothetical protein
VNIRGDLEIELSGKTARLDDANRTLLRLTRPEAKIFLSCGNCSSGGKDKLGSISKQDDRYLRGLFTAGCGDPLCQDPWHQAPALACALLARRPTKVVAIALANKIARTAWAVMAKGERYKQPVALAA